MKRSSRRLYTHPRARVGTTANLPNVADLRALVAAKDYSVAQMGKAIAKLAAAWSANDAAAYTDWMQDYAALSARYSAARTTAQTSLDAAKYIPMGDAIPVETQWNLLLRALRKNWNGTDGGALTKGDLIDLDARLHAAGGAPDYSQMPQPGPDLDLEIFKAADKATRAIDDVARTTEAAIPWVVLAVAGLAIALLARK